MPQKNGAPKGRLYNKYNRVKSKLTKAGLLDATKRKNVIASSSSSSKINENNAEENRVWLQHHQQPWNDVKSAWLSCTNYRINEIKSNDEPNLNNLIQRWPLYKHSLGHTLVRNFNFRIVVLIKKIC